MERNHEIDEMDYHSKEDAVDLFDNVKSRTDLKRMISNYDPKRDGILILITETTATWFITCKLK